MAFVPAPGAALNTKEFTGRAVSPTSVPQRVASVRMQTETEKESPVFGKAGKSMWKENLFTGGFPGGEAFYKAWAEDGMKADVPDVPDSMQSKNEFKPKTVKKGGVLGRLDATEFFEGFTRDQVEEASEAEEAAEDAESVADETTADSDEPNPVLYEQYFPAATRNIAPEIRMVYEKSFEKDRVYLAMTEVTASAVDVYYPKEMKNKAPIIDIYYGGSLKSAYVSVKLDDVEGLPTLPPPPKAGDAVTTLVPGSGGGLKLEYAVEGAGSVNI